MHVLDRALRTWSTTYFGAPELSDYAREHMLGETRRGLMTMSLVFLALLLASTLVHQQLGLGRPYLYTAAALTLLSAHVAFSCRVITDLKTLHLLGMVLLIVSGTAFVLLAHRTDTLGAVLFTSAGLLFMVVPMVPWGVREASLVTLLLYAVFASSAWTVSRRFDGETLWALQSFMLGAGVVSLTLVARGATVRRHDIESRFELERARREMEIVSLQDPLTFAWNRRYLEAEYAGWLEARHKVGAPAYLGVLDIDHFKSLNDRFGHGVGDQVLCWVARCVALHLGSTGHLVRAGGDEFIVLVDSDAPELLLEQAIDGVRALAAAEGPGGLPPICLSAGLVELPPGESIALEDAYLLGDGALYRAKRSPASSESPLRVACVAARQATRDAQA